jgi:drug/metabolite transporter (DMT)-like permease
MLVHRAMMSFLSLVCAIYSVISLPESVSLIILMLFPFFVGLAAFTFEKERLSIT